MNWAAALQILGITSAIVCGSLAYAGLLVWLEDKYRWGTVTLVVAIALPIIVIGSIVAGMVVP